MTEYCEFFKEPDDCKILKDECAVAKFQRSGCVIRLKELKKYKR